MRAGRGSHSVAPHALRFEALDWCVVATTIHDAGLLVIPADQLGPGGPTVTFRRQVQEVGGPGEEWFQLLTEAFKLYDARVGDLSNRAPGYWFPPRRQHLCVVLEGAKVRPYFQPFHGSSWLVHEGDFDPERSNPEFAAFQVAQAERLGVVRDVVSGLVCNLSWWTGRQATEVDDFMRACVASSRPDADGYRALAEAIPWLRSVHHEVLSPPTGPISGSVTAPGTGLVLAPELRPRLNALVRKWTEVVRGVAEQHYRSQVGIPGSSPGELVAWLKESRPQLVITGSKNEILWDPDEADDVTRVHDRLSSAVPSAIASIQADLEVIDGRSRAFISALTCPGELPAPQEETADQDGLCYMHIERNLVAYNLEEPGMQRLREPAPPFERAMVAARTIHEWGHLAAAAGWINVPEKLQPDFEKRLAGLGKLYDRILDSAPRKLIDQSKERLDRISANQPSHGAALAHLALERVEDFQANLLARRFLLPVEQETYVRNNVRSLVYEYGPDAMFERLARYAYEYQYLRFSEMPDARDFFLRSTWISEQYLVTGILDQGLLDELLQQTSALCDLYEVDEQKFRPVNTSSAQ